MLTRSAAALDLREVHDLSPCMKRACSLSPPMHNQTTTATHLSDLCSVWHACPPAIPMHMHLADDHMSSRTRCGPLMTDTACYCSL